MKNISHTDISGNEQNFEILQIFPDARKYDILTYSEVLNKNLKVMDSTAASLCRDNKIPILVFNLENPDNIIAAVCGKKIGTIVRED